MTVNIFKDLSYVFEHFLHVYTGCPGAHGEQKRVLEPRLWMLVSCSAALFLGTKPGSFVRASGVLCCRAVSQPQDKPFRFPLVGEKTSWKNVKDVVQVTSCSGQASNPDLLSQAISPVHLVDMFQKCTEGSCVRNLMLRVVVLSREGAWKRQGLLGIRLWGCH